MSTSGLRAYIKPKSRDITIRTREGFATIRASVYGPLAVNDVGSDGGGWMITHVPTGMAIYCAWTEQQARQIVRRLLDLPVDWSTITTRGIVDFDDNTKQQIKEALK